MRAYKWLAAGGRSAFAGFQWPLPQGGQPGAWVEVSAPLVLCRNGLHACRVDQLPHWLGPELWIVQLGGQVVEFDDVLVCSRARLVETVPSWGAWGRADFARDCARHAQSMRQPWWHDDYLADVLKCAEEGNAAAAGYLTAALAGEIAAGGGRGGPDYDRAFLGERVRQAVWLTERLALGDEAAGRQDR
jgi:hypothetical protein